MTTKEILLAASMLNTAADEYSTHGCNDWDFPPDWTEGEKVMFVREFHDFNGDPENFDPKFLFMMNFSVARLNRRVK